MNGNTFKPGFTDKPINVEATHNGHGIRVRVTVEVMTLDAADRLYGGATPNDALFAITSRMSHQAQDVVAYLRGECFEAFAHAKAELQAVADAKAPVAEAAAAPAGPAAPATAAEGAA